MMKIRGAVARREFDFARAEILLRDLDQIGKGDMPVGSLALSEDGRPRLVGVFTRTGLIRFGVRLARAALTAKSRVVVYDDARVMEDQYFPGPLMNLALADEPLMDEEPASAWPSQNCFGWLTVAALSVIGFATVVQWVVSLLRG